MTHYQSIALDGPAGAGKSTLARRLAAQLGYLYVDTGAIYRTLSLFALRRGVTPSNETEVKTLLPQAEIQMRYDPDGLQHMYLDGEDVTAAIRTQEVSAATSQLSAHPSVRAFLLETQRKLAQEHNVVMDGRDIGTTVLPNADVKLFLTAAPEERAKRRCRELLDRGVPAEFSAVLREINERDERDFHRAVAPLCQAEDAVLVDTTNLSLEESLAALLKVIREKLS